MAFDRKQFKELIKKTLNLLDPIFQSEAAVNLLLGTAAQESAFGTYLRQIRGPALGVFQMEPATHEDIWIHYIVNRIVLVEKIKEVAGSSLSIWALETNLAYQIIMTRLHYWRVSEALPDRDNIAGMALYWKKYYNTSQGKGTVQEFMRNYRRYVDPIT